MTTDNLALLKSLIDPSSGLTLEALGVQITYTYTENKGVLECTAGFPVHFWQTALEPLVHALLRKAYPDTAWQVTFTQAIRAHRTQLPGLGLRGIKNTLAIASGKGGVGKSTVAMNLAVAMARQGARVGLLDADIYGPSVPMMSGVTQAVSIENDHWLPILAHGVQTMSIGYLTQADDALIWRGPMLAKSLIQMINLTAWDNLDYLFIDLPPGTGDIQLSLVQKIPLTSAIVVTTPQPIATLDAQKAIQMFEKTGIHVLGLIENMTLHTCSSCGHREAIFGEQGAQMLSERCNIPVIAQLPLDKQIREHADNGYPVAASGDPALSTPWQDAGLAVSQLLAKTPINYADKFPPVKVE